MCLAFGIGSVQLYRLREVHPLRSQTQYDSISVRGEPVCGYLKIALRGRGEFFREGQGIGLLAVAQFEGEAALSAN